MATLRGRGWAVEASSLLPWGLGPSIPPNRTHHWVRHACAHLTLGGPCPQALSLHLAAPGPAPESSSKDKQEDPGRAAALASRTRGRV